MPKMKTKRAARKRLRKTGSGKLMRAGGWKQHKLEKKQPKRRRKLRKNQAIAPADQRRMKTLVPYL
jgi:large subunit ribosomal protein L35